MSAKDLLKLRELLINRRREIFEQVAHLESESKALGQRVIEPIDEAQKEDLTRMLDRLVERGKEEIKEINLALEKMSTGTYGLCELCGKSIPWKRLEVLPATRLCRKCAHEYEEAQKLRKHPKDEIIDTKLLNEYRNLIDEDVHLKTFKLPHDESLMDLKEI
ncbi:MAG: TraR/DksA C4-type zinc finger protein [Desulfobacterales bacterium]|jgi:DnaK suppressor protein